jgi:hypothetical protein
VGGLAKDQVSGQWELASIHIFTAKVDSKERYVFDAASRSFWRKPHFTSTSVAWMVLSLNAFRANLCVLVNGTLNSIQWEYQWMI